MTLLDRLAGAPISWGVCEVPGWGFQRSVDDVLAEMREVGLHATEFGPDGFLPADPAAKAARRGQHAGAGRVDRPGGVRRATDLGQGVVATVVLDTGHLLTGDGGPLQHPLDATWAGRVRAGEVGYAAAVAAGMYRPLGRGDVDVAEIVRLLEARGYTGWYVMEQDAVLTGPPERPAPPADVRASVEFLQCLA